MQSLVHRHDVLQGIGLIEIGLGRSVKAQIGEPALIGIGLNPIGFLNADQQFRAEVQRH